MVKLKSKTAEVTISFVLIILFLFTSVGRFILGAILGYAIRSSKFLKRTHIFGRTYAHSVVVPMAIIMAVVMEHNILLFGLAVGYVYHMCMGAVKELFS